MLKSKALKLLAISALAFTVSSCSSTYGLGTSQTQAKAGTVIDKSYSPSKEITRNECVEKKPKTSFVYTTDPATGQMKQTMVTSSECVAWEEVTRGEPEIYSLVIYDDAVRGTFPVSPQIYEQANVGDYFDSRTNTLTKARGDVPKTPEATPSEEGRLSSENPVPATTPSNSW